jgi:NitT/TauT family transport system ATP-binding protein
VSADDHLIVQNLLKVFRTGRGERQVVAIDNLSLRVKSGQFCSIVGPSGCGKSTFLRIAAGLVEPTSGTVSMGNETGPHDMQRAKQIGFVFQEPGLLPWKTVSGNVDVPFQVNRRANRPRGRSTAEMLELVGLTPFADAYPYQLSGGMQQRVAIARALAFDPVLLLMDEPFGALDEITRQSMRYELLRIWELTKKTVIFVTHSIPEAIILSDVVVVLSPRPGRVRGTVTIDLERPRTEAIERTPEFLHYTDRLKRLLREEVDNGTGH